MGRERSRTRSGLLDEILAAGMTPEVAAELVGVHVRTAYKHKAALLAAERQALEAIAQAALPSRVAALASALDHGAVVGTNTSADYRAYYGNIFAAYLAAYGFPGSPGEHREPAVRADARAALATDTARDGMDAIYAILDATWAARRLVNDADSEASRIWPLSETGADVEVLDYARASSHTAVQAFGIAFGFNNSPSRVPLISDDAVRNLTLAIEGAITAAKSAASGDSGEIGLARAAAAHAAYDDAHRAHYEAAFETGSDAVWDAASAGRAAIAPYATYIAWVAAAEAIRVLITSLPAR